MIDQGLGCYTCKDRKKQCNVDFSIHEVTGLLTCGECELKAIECILEKSDWADDPEKVKLSQEQRRKLMKLGMRKVRNVEGEDSDTKTGEKSGESGRERRFIFWDDIENIDQWRGHSMELGSSPKIVQNRALGKEKAIRGGLGGRH